MWYLQNSQNVDDTAARILGRLHYSFLHPPEPLLMAVGVPRGEHPHVAVGFGALVQLLPAQYV